MKATELRVGNLVKAKHTNGNPNKWVVIQIKPEHIVTCSDNPKWFKPIPLTENIIEKIGFELYDYEDIGEPLEGQENDFIILSYKKHKNKYVYYTLDGVSPRLYQFIICRETDNNSFVLAEINYLHQLQNLYFALTGEELKIKL